MTTFEEWFAGLSDEEKYWLTNKNSFNAGAASRDAEIAELVAVLENCNKYAMETLPTGFLAWITSAALAKVRKP